MTKLKKAFSGVVSKIGDPLLSETLIGPLHTPAAVEAYKKTIEEIKKQGGTIEFGGKVYYLTMYLWYIYEYSFNNVTKLY